MTSVPMPTVTDLYLQMTRSRMTEDLIARLWGSGVITGEMHMSSGEEAIIAGVLAHLGDKDALAVDHRSTAPAVIRGIDPFLIVAECIGLEVGLCKGNGGHMHLFSEQHRFASSGIVGSAGPAAVGFAIAAAYRSTGGVAVGFFGDGAINEGMLMEAFNLAVAWKLPVLFVCKDDGWAITTDSSKLSGGTISERANGFGLRSTSVDGTDAEDVSAVAADLVLSVRSGGGPALLHATCTHLDGHFLGDPLLKAARKPLREGAKVLGPAVLAALRKGAPAADRRRALADLLSLTVRSRRTHDTASDPLAVARAKHGELSERFAEIDTEMSKEVAGVAERIAAAIGERQGG